MKSGRGLVWFMVFNATFNNISVISRRAVLLVGKTRVPTEDNRHVASHWQTLLHNVVSNTPWAGFELTTFSGGRHWLHKAKYHTITTLTRGRLIVAFTTTCAISAYYH